MIESGPDMIGDVRSIIVWVMEKIGAFTKLIAWGMEITVPPSATIIDDAKIIVSETELIVTTAWLKGKTGRKESRKKGGSELKRSVNGSHCPPPFSEEIMRLRSTTASLHSPTSTRRMSMCQLLLVKTLYVAGSALVCIAGRMR